MRCYHFGNYYLSSIQQGIQAAHAQMELFNKYKEIDLGDYAFSTGHNPSEHIIKLSSLAEQLFEWSKNHKTMVCLNGGNNKDLLEIKELLTQNDMYPWSYFCEDEDSLGAVLTNVAIILPEEIYETARLIRERQYVVFELKVLDLSGLLIKELTEFEFNLIQTLNKCQLAK